MPDSKHDKQIFFLNFSDFTYKLKAYIEKNNLVLVLS